MCICGHLLQRRRRSPHEDLFLALGLLYSSMCFRYSQLRLLHNRIQIHVCAHMCVCKANADVVALNVHCRFSACFKKCLADAGTSQYIPPHLGVRVLIRVHMYVHGGLPHALVHFSTPSETGRLPRNNLSFHWVLNAQNCHMIICNIIYWWILNETNEKGYTPGMTRS